MRKKTKMQYVVSWEKDESDANLEGIGSSSFVPGVTHLRTGMNRKLPGQANPVGKPSSSTSSTNPKKKGQMKATKSKPQGVNDHDEPGIPGRDVTLQHLRPEDKKRVANLIKELAKTGEEKEEVKGQLVTERAHFKTKYVNLEAQMGTLKSERELLQQQYLQCQTLLAQSQERLSKEQNEQTELFRNVQPERDLSNGKSPMRDRVDPAQPRRQDMFSSKGSQQFHPPFQSTTKPEYDHARRVGVPPVTHSQGYPDHHPTHQQTMHHAHRGSYGQSTSTRGHSTHFPQRDHPMYAETGRAPGSGPSNPFSPTIFSADEFHPLPEELCSTSLGLLDSADDKGAMEPVRERDSRRQQPHERKEPRQQQLNHDRTMPPAQHRHDPHEQPNGCGANFPDHDAAVPNANHHLGRGMSAQAHLRNRGYSEFKVTDTGQMMGDSQQVSHQKGMITSEQLSQSSGRGSPSESRMATPDMLVKRKRRLDEQKAQLRREQEWLQKELRNQEELLHQKQLELEAHRQSLLDSPHPRGPPMGWHQPVSRRLVNGVNGVQEGLHEQSLHGKTPSADGYAVFDSLTHRGQTRDEMRNGPGRSYGDAVNGHRGQLVYETHDPPLHSRQTMGDTRQSLLQSPHHGGHAMDHSERMGPEQGRRNGVKTVNRSDELTPHEQYLLGSHGQPVDSRVLQGERWELLSKPSASGHPMGEEELRLEGRNGSYSNQEEQLDHRQPRRVVSVAAHRDVRMENGQFMTSDDDRCEGRMKNGTRGDGTYGGTELIQGSVALHSDSVTKGGQTNRTLKVDVSTAPIRPPPQPPRRGVSPAIHHPSSGLAREAWVGDTSSDERSEGNHQEYHRSESSGNRSKEDDLNLLQDLIEDLNSLPSPESSVTSQPLPLRVPTAIPHQPRVSSRHHSTANRTGILSAQSRSRVTMMDDPGLTRIVGSEIVESSDGEEESRILGDIFFLN